MESREMPIVDWMPPAMKLQFSDMKDVSSLIPLSPKGSLFLPLKIYTSTEIKTIEEIATLARN